MVNQLTAILAKPLQSPNEKIKQYGEGKQPGHSDVTKYLTEHHISVENIGLEEVQFRGSDKDLRQLVKDYLGEDEKYVSWWVGEYK